MKRLLPVLIAVALLVPAGQAFAAKAKKAKKAKVAVSVERCSGDADVKAVSLGKEVLYVSQDMASVSFTKSVDAPLKHNLVYFCAKCNEFKTVPGACGCGDALTPGFRHGETWFALSKDENGNPVLSNAPAVSPSHMIDAEPMKKPAKKIKKASKKGEKKAKKSKKAKKAAKAVENVVSDVAPGSEPAPAGK